MASVPRGSVNWGITVWPRKRCAWTPQNSKCRAVTSERALLACKQTRYWPKTNSPCVVQTVLGDVALEVHRPADGPALGAGVGRFVLMDSLVWGVAALVRKQHLADSASLLDKPKGGDRVGPTKDFLICKEAWLKSPINGTLLTSNTALVASKPKEKAKLES